MKELDAIIKETFDYQMSIDGGDTGKAVINTVRQVLRDRAKPVSENRINELDLADQAARALTDICHRRAALTGWWDASKAATDKSNPLHFASKLALIHSEVSEAMEGDRKNKMDEHLPHRPSREVELADAVIRIFDLAGGYGMDIAGAIAEKLEYNAQRQDHKPEVRAAAGGKIY